MKEQIDLPTDGGKKEDQDQANEDIKSLKRPVLPKLAHRITGYRCGGTKVGFNLETGELFDAPCDCTSDDPDDLCTPIAMHAEDEGGKDD